jgi:hypothetical protein
MNAKPNTNHFNHNFERTVANLNVVAAMIAKAAIATIRRESKLPTVAVAATPVEVLRFGLELTRPLYQHLHFLTTNL